MEKRADADAGFKFNEQTTVRFPVNARYTDQNVPYVDFAFTDIIQVQYATVFIFACNLRQRARARTYTPKHTPPHTHTNLGCLLCRQLWNYLQGH